MTLESIREVFEHGFGVAKARELRKIAKMEHRRIGSVSEEAKM